MTVIGDLLGIANREPWQDQALCAQVDPEIFFPDKSGSARQAKAICATCPVQTRCLEFALERNERYGVFGGMTERERQELKKPRPVGLCRNGHDTRVVGMDERDYCRQCRRESQLRHDRRRRLRVSRSA